MISLEKAAKSRGGRLVLASVDLKLRKGEVLCLIGPSGSGKSTLLDVAAGLLKPDHGRRTIGEGRLGYALQEECFLPWLTARENLIFFLSGSGLPDISRQADYWLERLGLSEFADVTPGRLSGGQRRRLNLARSLAMEPDLLLWDEPFAFLDPVWQGQASILLKEARDAWAPAVITAVHQEEPKLLPGWPKLEITRYPVEIKWGC